MANTEREVLKVLEGDCDTAIGTFSNIEGNNINLVAELFSVDGKKRYFIKDTKKVELAKELGREIGEALKLKSEDKQSELPLDFTFAKVDKDWKIDRIAKVSN